MSRAPAAIQPRRRACPALAVALALLGAGAGTGLAGATQGTVLDYPTIDNPHSLLLGDSGAQARWQALFEPYPSWVSRQIAFLTWRVPERAPTLLAARLLYSGDPWTRRETDSTNDRRWHLSDIETRSAILREMRWLKDPALVDVWMVRPDLTPALALHLGDPRLGDAYPAAQLPATRQSALSFVIDTCGVDSPQARQLLEWALLHTTGTERNHAITSMSHGSFPDLLKPTILALAEERRQGQLDDAGSEGLVMATSRLGADIDPELAKVLVEIAVDGTREIATSAATALANNVSWQTSVPIEPIAKRAAEDPDPVVRDALLNLLLRINPDAAAQAGGPDSPWTVLAEHRRKLQKWEWEQYVK